MRIIEVAGGEAHAGTDDLHDLLHELVGALLVDTASQRRLINLHMTDCIHQQIGQIIFCRLALTVYAADAHVDERLIAGEELGLAFRR